MAKNSDMFGLRSTNVLSLCKSEFFKKLCIELNETTSSCFVSNVVCPNRIAQIIVITFLFTKLPWPGGIFLQSVPIYLRPIAFFLINSS